MRRKKLDIALGFVISILMVLSATQHVLAQCNWSTKVVLNDFTSAVPGLTATGDRLVLTWSVGVDGVLNSMISFDGVNWSNKVTRTDFPRIAWGYRGGLGMTYSPTCGYVYVGWRDGSNNMWATRSVDGINWEAPRFIVSATALSAPALRGDNGALPIGFAFSTYSSTPNFFTPIKGKFNCDFSNPVLPSQANFWNPFHETVPTPVAGGQEKAIMPLWTGAGGTTELSTYAIGAQVNSTPGVKYIHFQVNNSYPYQLYAGGINAWSNNGVAGTVNPNDGAPYIVWTCHPDDGDTCKPESTGRINIFKMVEPINSGGVHRVCADWSTFNPAVTFFQGKIWIAWKGGGTVNSAGFINIASIDPL
jgi:hypothetical protein